MKKLLTKAIIAVMISVGVIPLSFALSTSINLYATDTVAGYGTLIKISNAPSNQDIEIVVEKPDKSKVSLQATTDQYGKAKLDLEGFYTKKAGQYKVSTHLSEENHGVTESFRVYADKVSATRSTMEINRQTANANGNDYVELKTYLKDQYNNPIPGHSIQLLSSRLTDEIVRISPQGYTDEQGMLLYHLYSKKAGISTFLGHDSTENITLNDRARIVFYEPISQTQAQGGHKVYLAAANSGPVSNLKFEDIPESVKVGQTLNFTVSAYDDNGNIATDYTGLVRFSASDGNAGLPNDYQFEAEDQGSHTFSLSLSLQTTGTQTLTVTDINDTDVYGELDVEVTNKTTGQSSTTNQNTPGGQNVSGSGEFDLFTPAPGTYSNNSLSFTGEAEYGLTIQILDNGQILGSTDVKPDGSFTYTATSLGEGQHVFFLKLIDSENNLQDSSAEINVIIDTDAPELDQIEVSPEGGVPAGTLFSITAYTEPNLPKMSIILNNGIFEMTEDSLVDGVYKVSLTSPRETGEYRIDALLVDELGNEVVYNDALRLTVIENTNPDEITPEEEEIITEETDSELPGKVTGVQAIAEDGQVTLSWEAPQTSLLEEELVETDSLETNSELIQTLDLSEDQLAEFEEALNNMTDEELTQLFDEFNGNIEAFMDSQEEALTETLPKSNANRFLQKESDTSDNSGIDHYRIYYGPDPELMYNHVDTLDNSTTWKIENLSNETTYYFVVVAVTPDGLESEERSDPVTATPKSDEAEALFAAAQEEATRQAELEAQAEALRIAQANAMTPDTGPEVFWLLLMSVVFGTFYFKKERQQANITRVRFNDIQ